jgi:Vacuolar protein sorting protein 11 C terminal
MLLAIHCYIMHAFPIHLQIGSNSAIDSEYVKYEEIKRSQAQRATDHEQFYKDLEESTDGFAEVALAFGKGLIP